MTALFGKKEEEKKDKKPVKENVLDMANNSSKDEVIDKAAKKTDDADKKSDKPAVKISKINTGDAYKVLTRPTVSEKAYAQVAMGKYTFKVNPAANKISIRKAIEMVYDVKVARVNIIRTPGKSKTSGKTRGRTSATKKAIVTLKKGQTITQ